MVSEGYTNLIDREKFKTEIAIAQISEIYENTLLSEKRATEILNIVMNEPSLFHLLNSIIDFNKVNNKFYSELCSLANRIFLDSKLEIVDYTLISDYRKMMLEIISKRKEIFKEIIMNKNISQTSKKEDKGFNQMIDSFKKALENNDHSTE